jgi:hypothetical protein
VLVTAALGLMIGGGAWWLFVVPTLALAGYLALLRHHVRTGRSTAAARPAGRRVRAVPAAPTAPAAATVEVVPSVRRRPAEHDLERIAG